MIPLILLTPPVRYANYVNDRYGFAVDRPTFLIPQRPPGDGDGREFRAGRIVMRAYAGWNADNSTPASALHDAIRNEAKGAKPTLAVSKAQWFALSYSKGGTVFYEKSVVTPKKRTTVEFEYPVAEATRMVPIVARVARSLRP